MEEQKSEGYEKVKSTSSKPTFFHDVLNSDLPPEEKEPARLAQEVQVLIGAGGETAAKMLAWTIYYLLESPEKMHKLKEELDRLDPSGTATLIDYERMPYLVSASSHQIAPTNCRRHA
jgi:cytochrome P450